LEGTIVSILEHNLDALRFKNPLLYQRLSTIQTDEMFHIHMDGNDPSTLNLINLSDFTPLYSAKASEQTNTQIVEFQQWSQYPYLYLFGMGNGVLIASLLDSSIRKRVVVVEPEVEVLWIVLHFIDFSQAIQSGRLVILSDTSLSFAGIVGLFGDNDVKRYARVYDMHVNLPYYERFAQRIQEINQLFVQALRHVITTVGNDVTDTLIGMEHHFMNLDLMVQTPTLYELFKKAKNTNMAVLVSTGPSLNKQLPLLKEVAPYVTIVAVDASFPVLSAYGIKPDIVVSMERIALSSTFFKNTPAEFYDGVVFSLSSLQHPELLRSIKGGVIQMSMRPFGFMQAFELDQWGYIGIGMSAANKAYELIYHSRFERCVLIGQDLAYSDGGLSHAQGHVLGADEVKAKASDVDVVRYGGEGMIRTSAVWNWFRSFFETDIRETAARMETINATEGGARIAGAIEMPFREVIERYVQKDMCKKPIVLEKVKKSDLKTVLRRIEAKKAFIIKTITEAKREAESLFIQVAQFCEQNDSIDGNELLQSIMKFYTKVHDKVLAQLLFDATQALLFHQEMVICEIEVRYASSESEQRDKILELIPLYKEWLFSLAGCIDAILVAMERQGSHYNE